MTIHVGVLTVSDRCARGLRVDESGPALRREIERRGWKMLRCRVVPDEQPQIKEILLRWCDEGDISLILTTGGTGLSPRDITPEATREVLDKELSGFGELMRSSAVRTTPTAALSRALAGSRGKTLIINLPGSPKGAAQSLSSVADLVPHALAMLDGAGHAEKETPHARS
ncbi:MAG: MogA/MoaB family molybdenum cofactor biosynthesis protein [Elusimicrobia bacterium]|nr:MogA/MoaB family molybdenum cofactor biosynthesis protein [Elusimicrobiota bacterium]